MIQILVLKKQLYGTGDKDSDTKYCAKIRDWINKGYAGITLLVSRAMIIVSRDSPYIEYMPGVTATHRTAKLSNINYIHNRAASFIA